MMVHDRYWSRVRRDRGCVLRPRRCERIGSAVIGRIIPWPIEPSSRVSLASRSGSLRDT